MKRTVSSGEIWCREEIDNFATEVLEGAHAVTWCSSQMLERLIDSETFMGYGSEILEDQSCSENPGVIGSDDGYVFAVIVPQRKRDTQNHETL